MSETPPCPAPTPSAHRQFPLLSSGPLLLLLMGRGCGGGGLRILPHKSWNVYGYENKQKVKADEAAHKIITDASDKAAREADAEFRLTVLRRQAQRRKEQEQAQEEVSTTNGLEPAEAEGAEDNDESASGRPQSRPPAAAAAAAPSRPLRFVVQQEAEPDSTSHSAAASSASSSTATAAVSPAVASALHFSLFDKDVGSSQQSAQMERMKAQSARASELAHMKQHAPVTLFVESFKEADGTSALRPWYAQSDEERAATEVRQREQQKRQVRIKKRTDGRGGVQLMMNPTGEPVHSSIADPLDEMRTGLRALDVYHAKQDAQEERRQYDLPPAHSSVAAEAEAAVAASSVLQDAIAQAKLQAATAAAAAASSSAPAFASPSAMHRSISTSSDHLPALQPLWSQAGLTSPPPVDSVSGGRRSRWGESLPPQADLHYSAAVGFTNAESALLPGAMTQSATAMQPSLFASAAPHPASRSRSPSSSSSSSSSSDSSSDSRSESRLRRHKKHRASKHRSRSRSRSRSRDHKHSKHPKHSKKNKRERSHRSESDRHSRSMKHDRDRDREKKKDDRKRKRSRSPKRKRSEAASSSSAAPAATAAPAVLPGFKSTEELRAERSVRERTERERAAALLNVPVWAAAHPNSVQQRDLRDERLPSDSSKGRPSSDFAYNRRS